jgi:hypothetical protein
MMQPLTAPPPLDEQAELLAWKWLLALERVPFDPTDARAGERQVIIRLHPGKLNPPRGGAPLVRVTATHPRLPGKRFRGSGNSLYEAVCQLSGEFWRAGVRLPLPGSTTTQEQIDELVAP